MAEEGPDLQAERQRRNGSLLERGKAGDAGALHVGSIDYAGDGGGEDGGKVLRSANPSTSWGPP
eukprot:8927086-Alexandrium_andersonii.AAC.1